MATLAQYEIEEKCELSISEIKQAMDTDLDYHLAKQEYEETRRLAKEIGLENGITAVRQQIIDWLSQPKIQLAVKLGYGQLSNEDVHSWRAWVKSVTPKEIGKKIRLKRYISIPYMADGLQYAQNWSYYQGDKIPVSIQKVIAAELKNPLWDYLVIETFCYEELRAFDPICYASISRNIYDHSVEASTNFLLARWGESDEALVSWDDIREYSPRSPKQARKKILGLF